MKINITGRHFEVTEDLSKYAEKKLKKLEKYLHKPVTINLIMYMEKHNHVIEATVDGETSQFYSTEKANDMYSSIDLLIKSLEKQIVRNKEKHTEHKVIPLTKTIRSESEAEDTIKLLINQIENKPKDAIEAYLEMKVDNKDFILFKKNIEANGGSKYTHAVIYRTENGFKMAEVPFDNPDNGSVANKGDDILAEFDLIIRDESIHNPDIEFKQCNNTVKGMDVNNAVKELMQKGEFMPFFNNETDFLNVVFKNKNNIELFTPVA